MSYYDFDDHFWSPREVCAIAPKTESKQGFLTVLHSLRQLFLAANKT
jgi:hypothetical protein